MGESAGDGDALALTATELVRVAIFRIWRQSHLGEEFLHPILDRLAGAVAIHHQGLGDSIADAPPWAQRRPRILKHRLHSAAEVVQLLPGEILDIFAIQDDAPLGWRFQAHQQLGGSGFATSRFAHEAQGLALPDGEVKAIDGLHVAKRPHED